MGAWPDKKITSAADADLDHDEIFSESELNALTVTQLKALAAELGYTVTANRKADIVDEILAQQEALPETADANSDSEYSEEELNALTVGQLKTLAAQLSITLTATTKAAIITEILAALAPEEDPSDDDT